LDFLEIGEQQARSYSATMTLIFRLRDGPNKSRDRNVAAAHPDLSSRVFQEEIEISQIAPTIPARPASIRRTKERARTTNPALARLRRLKLLKRAQLQQASSTTRRIRRGGGKQRRARFIPTAVGFFSFVSLSFATARFLSQSRAADGDCWQRWHFNKTS
jgi:hypothetical protein